MKTIPAIIILLLSSTCLSLSEETKGKIDPVLAALRSELESELAELEPSPEIETSGDPSGKTLILRYKTRKYLIYPRDKTGRIGTSPVESEGPNDEGVLLRAYIQRAGEVNQAAVPQTIHEPYWKTYLNIYPVADSGKQIYLALSYRGMTDKKLIEEIQVIAKGLKVSGK